LNGESSRPVLGRQERCGARLTAFRCFLVPLQPSAAFRGLLFGCASKTSDAVFIVMNLCTNISTKAFLPRNRSAFFEEIFGGLAARRLRACRPSVPDSADPWATRFALNSKKGCNSSLVNGCADLAASSLKGSECCVKLQLVRSYAFQEIQ
jgi:hypothetical protein